MRPAQCHIIIRRRELEKHFSPQRAEACDKYGGWRETTLCSVLRQQTRPKHEPGDPRTHSAWRTIQTPLLLLLQPLRSASISTLRAAEPRRLIHSLQPSRLRCWPPPRRFSARALTCSWPGTSPGRFWQTAEWLSSSLCPPCRPVSMSSAAAPRCVKPPRRRHLWGPAMPR